jgi:SWI/SNF-related matrix-associated actin-dependent regulator of chromatin subfamily E protein 1
VCYWGF